MADTHEVIQHLQIPEPAQGRAATKLLAIVANKRGAEEAVRYPRINCLGFPFSVSPTFQQRNTNSSIEESLVRVAEIKELCEANGKELVIYISMAFGNPYHDEWSKENLVAAVAKIAALGIRSVSLADTVGVAKPELIREVMAAVVAGIADAGLEIGVHLHSTRADAAAKVLAAYDAGCRRFDAAMGGLGGCPFAQDRLVGNIPTEEVLKALSQRRVPFPMSSDLEEVMAINDEISREFSV